MCPRTTKYITDARRGSVRNADMDAAPLQEGTHGSEIDHRELVAATCEYFCHGMKVKEIRKRLVARYGKVAEMSRARPYQLLAYAAQHGWIRFHPPAHLAMQRQIEDEYNWLKRVRVVHTTVASDVAFETAHMLRSLVQQCHRDNPEREEVHVGLAAGRSTQLVANALAELLTEPAADLPKYLVLHAMVTGYDPGDPTTDSNSFFTFFRRASVLQVEPKFVGLHAPAMVRTKYLPQLRENPEIKEAYRRVEELDIIVTSGSDWEDDHSSLRVCMERSKPSMKALREAGTVGDLLWRPLSNKGPVECKTEVRAMTLTELSELPGFIRRGKHVLLMLGPCSDCNRPKGSILHTILHQKERLVSHVALDSRTAGQLIERMAREQA